MTTTETTTTNVHPKLTNLALGLVREVGTHMVMTADGNLDLEYGMTACSFADELACLLVEEPAIDKSFQMLHIAENAISRLIDDMYEYREYQETEPMDMEDLLGVYRVVGERIGRENFSWLEPIEQWIENEI